MRLVIILCSLLLSVSGVSFRTPAAVEIAVNAEYVDDEDDVVMVGKNIAIPTINALTRNILVCLHSLVFSHLGV